MGVKWWVILCVVFHSIYMISIFDIYFRSPLVHGMTPQQPQKQAPAKRLVLFVGDGLRAHTLFANQFNSKSHNPQFLRQIIETKGGWGVSHSRVPTESRPGHVAMIAGFYEDVSAVTKGWKTNPVEFDSLFNASRETWSWGSPDILPMFSDSHSHVHSHSYPPEFENFASNSSELDLWVFQKVEEFFASVKKNTELEQRINSDKVVFFMHLLGIDSSGHAHRPHSPEYLETLEIVDAGVERIYNLFENYFGDSKTAYIFTSDHGMSNKGAHGDGDPQNTRTPLVVWGPGIRSPLSASLSPSIYHQCYKGENYFDTPSEWELNDIFRCDIEQADLAPFMAALIGVHFPMNSVGVLPISFLSMSTEDTLHYLFLNAKQIYLQFLTKSILKEKSIVFFKPFLPLQDAEKIFNHIELLIQNKEYEKAIVECKELIKLSLEGLHYFQTYDRPFLMIIVSLGYISFICCVVMYLLQNYTNLISSSPPILSVSNNWEQYIGTMTLLLMYIFLFLESAPLQYYLYVFFPVVFWTKLFFSFSTSSYPPILLFAMGMKTFFFKENFGEGNSKKQNWRAMLTFFFLLSAVALAVMIGGYYQRELYSILVIVVGFSPYASLWLSDIKKRQKNLEFTFLLFSIFLSIFPLLPIDPGTILFLVFLGGILVLFFCYLKLQKVPHNSKSQYLLKILFSMGIVSLVQVAVVQYLLASRLVVPTLFHILSWSLMGASFGILLVPTKEHVEHFLIKTILCLSIPFILLSVAYEVLFYFVFCLVLWLWFLKEKTEVEQTPQLYTPTSPLSFSDCYNPLFFIIFCYVGFFGTGNIATIGSYEISSTYRFITVFNPFVMGALLMVKIMIPLLVASIVFSAINKLKHKHWIAWLLSVVVFSDVMSLYFFFAVRDYGSWKEIGESISHFAICNMFILFALLMLTVSNFITRNVVFSETHKQS